MIMRLLIIVFTYFLFISCKSQNTVNSDQNIVGSDQADTIPADIIKGLILERLNNDIKEFKEFTGDSIGWNEISIRDLIDISNKDSMDTSNKGLGYIQHIKFIKNHVYHLSPYIMSYSFSYIVHLKNDGELKIFEAINCKDRGDSIEDVLRYINANKDEFNNLNELLERVKNYRKYGSYIQMDEFDSIRCDCSPCE
jgi:hypothetical protein